jgi:hypothetical protein
MPNVDWCCASGKICLREHGLYVLAVSANLFEVGVPFGARAQALGCVQAASVHGCAIFRHLERPSCALVAPLVAKNVFHVADCCRVNGEARDGWSERRRDSKHRRFTACTTVLAVVGAQPS